MLFNYLNIKRNDSTAFSCTNTNLNSNTGIGVDTATNELRNYCSYKIIPDTSSILQDAGFCMLRYFTQFSSNVKLCYMVLRELNDITNKGMDLLANRAKGTLRYLSSNPNAEYRVVQSPGFNGDESIVNYVKTCAGQNDPNEKLLILTNDKELAMRILELQKEANCTILVKKPKLLDDGRKFELVDTLEKPKPQTYAPRPLNRLAEYGICV